MGDSLPIPSEFGLELSALAVWDPPKSWSRKRREMAIAGLIPKVTRPDLDNILKGFKDAVRKIVYHDDDQVVGYGCCYKIYGNRPRLEVRLTIVERVPLVLPTRPISEHLLTLAAAA
jgi:Holliday junction resolvase RusA-like endonuclease